MNILPFSGYVDLLSTKSESLFLILFETEKNRMANKGNSTAWTETTPFLPWYNWKINP